MLRLKRSLKNRKIQQHYVYMLRLKRRVKNRMIQQHYVYMLRLKRRVKNRKIQQHYVYILRLKSFEEQKDSTAHVHAQTEEKCKLQNDTTALCVRA
jgi:hypothetical protein